jgi:hypothetical protein
MIVGRDRQETIKLTAAALGIGLAEAEEIVAIELGEIDGDCVAVDDDGNEVRRPPDELDMQVP